MQNTMTGAGAYQMDPAQMYERYFVPAIGRPFAQEVIDRAGLRTGEHVLDVACGTGIVARLAAAAVGPTGVVTGLDPVPPMLAAARAASPPGARIDWVLGSAEEMPEPQTPYDVALCSLGLMFFADRSAALRRVGECLAPGGRLVVATPGPTPALFEELDALLVDHLGTVVAGFFPRVFSVHDPVALRGLFEGSGLDEVSTYTDQVDLDLPGPVDFLWQYVLSTPLAAALATLDADARAALERDADKRLGPFTRGGRIPTRVGRLVARGTVK